jgi:hypothetical protein
MKLNSFGTGAGIGIVTAIPLLLLTELFGRWGSDANLVNFSPAIIGIALLTIEITLALISLILGCFWLVRRRWRRAGFGLAFSVVVIVGLAAMWLRP